MNHSSRQAMLVEIMARRAQFLLVSHQQMEFVTMMWLMTRTAVFDGGVVRVRQVDLVADISVTGQARFRFIRPDEMTIVGVVWFVATHTIGRQVGLVPG
jgi:5,10-methylene-tetrahydrofolate dehydrogenase/methenyl tetrahydrofolate cyclohydrolase